MKSVKCFVENVPKTTHRTTQSESKRVDSVQAAWQPGRRANVNKNCAPKNDAVNKTAPDADKCSASTEGEGRWAKDWKAAVANTYCHDEASPFCRLLLLLLHCEIFAMQIGPENCSTLERCSSAIKCKIFNNAAVHKNDRIR